MFNVLNKSRQNKAKVQGYATDAYRDSRSGAPSFNEARRDCHASLRARNRAFLL